MLCKPRRAAIVLLMTVVVVSGCHPGGNGRTVSLPELESAAVRLPQQTRQVVLRDPDALGELYIELAPRLGVVACRTRAEWDRLAAVAPDLGPAPDFSRGSVIALVSRAGSPVNGRWPIHVKYVRLHDGAGLLVGGFEAGSYLPDGAAYLELAYVQGLEAILVVDVNGLRYVL